MFLTADLIMFMMFITLKMLIPYFLVFKGVDAAKAVWDLEWGEMSIIDKLWDQTIGQ